MLSRTARGVGLALVALLAAAAAPAPPTTAPKAFAPILDPALHNAHRVTEKVLSGAQPDDDAAFKALHDLGVKTIVSVDGARPDVEGARKYGMRYVHLPIGYDGVDPDEGKAIAKALAEMPGPIYLHCHHGKHRSAAAVAVACVYNGSLPPEKAEAVLKTFGTGANYKGLWSAARGARPIDQVELSALKIEYVEAAKISDLADAMVKVDHHWDHVKATKEAGWRAPADHPDLDPAHEALQVREHFHEIGRTEDVKTRPAEYRKLLGDGEAAARELETALMARPVDAGAADAAFKRTAESCAACHKAFRD